MSEWNVHPFLPDPRRPLVLASQSPRRADILRAQGLRFTIAPAEVDESALPDEAPGPHVERLALEKARAIAAIDRTCVALGCDTVVVIDGEILGKPRDAAHARAMLARLAGREHVVFSAVALASGERAVVGHETTRVRFRALREDEIAAYVASGEPMDKAGAYGIQGQGAMIVAGIDGCYFNVMGLPLQTLRRLWTDFFGRAAEGAR